MQPVQQTVRQSAALCCPLRSPWVVGGCVWSAAKTRGQLLPSGVHFAVGEAAGAGGGMFSEKRRV